MAKRKTPTEKQIEALAALDDEQLLTKSLEAMHALNRRVKEKRDRRNHYRRARFAKAIGKEIEAIYALKDRYTTVLVRAGKAKLLTFEVERSGGWMCMSCAHEWGGWGDDCYACGGRGERLTIADTWFIVDCGPGYRFHQPMMPADLAAVAERIPPHEPRQAAREIPEIGLTVAAQHRCVEMMIERIRVAGINTDSVGTASAPRNPFA